MNKDRLEAYRKAALKAVEYQLGFFQPDGGYIWEGYVRDAFHKQPYSWQMAGRYAEAHKLLNWIKSERLQSCGRLKDYNGDIYKHAWLAQGSHRLGRFDISYPVMSFLLSCQEPCGGLPLLESDECLRAIGTSWAGTAALYSGNIGAAEKAAGCCARMLEQQKDKSKLFFEMTRSGKILTLEDDLNAEYIDVHRTRQCYWEAGFPMLLMCKMHQATGEKSYLDYAGKFFEFQLGCREDSFSYWGSGKGALAAAIFYSLTGDERGRDAACRFCDFVVATQQPEGGFRYEDEPDELLYYVDHAACFSVWVPEITAVLQSM